MKAQRRHDLKTNTLAEQLAAAIEWTKRNSTYFTVGIVAVAVAIGGLTWYRYNVRATQQRAWLELANNTFLMPLEAREKGVEAQVSRVRQLAAAQGNGPLAAAAWNELGGLHASQAMLPPSGGTDGGSAIRVWQEARDAYESALRAAGDEAVPAAAARLGLGVAVESLAALGSEPDGFDQAETHYQAIISDKRLENSPLRAAAEKRQQALGGLREPITFAPSTQPAEREISGDSRPSSTRPAVGKAAVTKPSIAIKKGPTPPGARAK